jgi:pimeloyl-ACP methyl ester carboxylesterase
MQRKDDQEPGSGASVAEAQIAAFREWEQFDGERFADLQGIHHPTLVVNGVHDEMIPVANSFRLGERLPNAVLLTYPDSVVGVSGQARAEHCVERRPDGEAIHRRHLQ